MNRACVGVAVVLGLCATGWPKAEKVDVEEAISRRHTVFNGHEVFSEAISRPCTIFNGHVDFSEAISRAPTTVNYFYPVSEAITRPATTRNMFCIEDLNDSGVVDAGDLALILGAWGPNPLHPADLTENGAINAADLAMLLGHWGPCP